MARFTFRLPDIGEGIAEAEIVAWHVKIGDRVEEDQQVADMMTDKATVEMESPVSGVVVELAGEVGDQVPIGSALMVIEVEGEGEAEAETPVEEQVEAENPGVEEATDAAPSAPLPLAGGVGGGAETAPAPATATSTPPPPPPPP
uniref:biotin/lipoyl-containing protein n=1 Tax=Sphingomonas azotifigens TaxID=330920 RepID=UPI0027390DC5